MEPDLTPRGLFVVEPCPTGWAFRHTRSGRTSLLSFTTPRAALAAAQEAERVALGRVVRTARARRAAAARRARDVHWRGCSKPGSGAVRWLPNRAQGEDDPGRVEGWYLVVDLPEADVEVEIDHCPWCGGPLDPLAGVRGQNVFEIVSRQPLRGFSPGEDQLDWPEDFDPGP